MALQLSGDGSIAGLAEGLNGVGKVIQVVTAITSTQAQATTQTQVDTNLSVTITPSSATSKVLILGLQSGTYKGSNTSDGLWLWFYRDSSQLRRFAKNAFTGMGSVYGEGIPIVYLDSPNTTSAVTYKTTIQSSRSSGGDVRVQANSDTHSVMVAIEVAA